MLILAVVAGLIVGWCTGGRLFRFEAAGLRMLPLPILALLCQWAMNALAGVISLPWEVWAWCPILVSYALILLFLGFNRHLLKTLLCAGAGSLGNLAVIAANGWRMPVSHGVVEVLSAEGAADLLSGTIPMYRAADETTRLLFLGDILSCPLPLVGGLASVGDILLALGVFFCLMAVMGPVRGPGWLKTG